MSCLSDQGVKGGRQSVEDGLHELSSEVITPGLWHDSQITNRVNVLDRRLKCNNAQPACARCMKRGAKCVRSFNVRFKHYSNTSPPTSNSTNKSSQYNFPPNQTWCASGDLLSFVDEGQNLRTAYELRSDSDTEENVVSSPSARPEEQNFNIIAPPDFHIQDNDALDFTAAGAYAHLASYHWPASDDGQGEKQPSNAGSDVSAIRVNEKPRLYQDVSVWPLNDATEARLVRYFIDHVSRRFDLCDPNKHFASVVPYRAAVCPPLMDAALALSARYLSKTTAFDEYMADRYYQRCLNSLVPMFSEVEALLNHDLFAAIVILRTLEEIEVPLSGADSRTHLFGSHLFVSASTGESPSSAPSSKLTGIRRAAFLVAFRQEVCTAFVSQRPVLPSFHLHDVDRSVENPADDCTWTNRILLHAAEVLGYCFNEISVAADVSNERYGELAEYGHQWYDKKPKSFSPIFYGTIDGENGHDPGPSQLSQDVLLLSDAEATGLLNYHLSRILLLAFDPRTPRLGPSRFHFLKRQNWEIKREVTTLIGMANGNSGCASHFVLACMGIALAGDRFEARWEQDQLLQFLRKTETVYAWSTSTAQNHLMDAWGWVEEIV